MRRVRPLLFLAVPIVFLVTACSDASSPLGPLMGQAIQSISIANHNGRTVVLTQPEDIQFVVSHLSALPTQRGAKVNPEFELEFRPLQGIPLRLRLERSCIGPDVPASDVVNRWYFADGALYDFVASRVNRAS